MTLTLLTLLVSLLGGLLMTAATPMLTAMMLFALAISMTLFIHMYSTWASFTLFMIYIGGVMVMFSYFISVAPTPEKTTPRLPIPLIIILMLAYAPLGMSDSMSSPLTTESQTPPGSILNSPWTLLFLAMILLLILVIATKVSTRNQGSLRPHL